MTREEQSKLQFARTSIWASCSDAHLRSLLCVGIEMFLTSGADSEYIKALAEYIEQREKDEPN